MRVGLYILVLPLEAGGMHVRVSPMQMEEHQRAKNLPDVISVDVDKSPYVESESDLRVWVNSVTRLVARTLEDDLYERWTRPAVDRIANPNDTKRS